MCFFKGVTCFEKSAEFESENERAKLGHVFDWPGDAMTSRDADGLLLTAPGVFYA